MNRVYKTHFSLIIWIVSLVVIGVLLIRITSWAEPVKNDKGSFYLHPENTNSNQQRPDLDVDFRSRSGVIFRVQQIQNAPYAAVNPHFPVILISPNIKVDGWIHVVYTDARQSSDCNGKTFVDYDPQLTKYPLYNNTQYFYDAPLWSYSLFNKPLRFWKGHAFAVKVDHQKKSIHCLGGIEWGFELSYFRLRPKATAPQLLNKEGWEKAWQILQEKLPDYSQTYGGM